MPYSDLVIVPKIVSLSEDGLIAVMEDNSGTFPETAGGFAPSGEGTATRPALDEVQIRYIYRGVPFGGDFDFAALGDELSLANDGGTLASNSWQVVEVVLDDSLDWSTIRLLGFEAIVALASESGALGQIALISAPSQAICVNEERMRLNNAQMNENCTPDPQAFMDKDALQQAAYSGGQYAAGFGSTQVLNPDCVAAYEGVQDILTKLGEICDNPDNCANCNCG